MNTEITKKCHCCALMFPLSGYHKCKKHKDGYNTICKECNKAKVKKWVSEHKDYVLVRQKEYSYKNREKANQRSKEYYHAHKEQDREYSLKKHYGINVETFIKIFDFQGGVCAICKQPNKTRALAVDHNHETEEVRGLLCDPCNLGLGALKDSAEICNLAAQYLNNGGSQWNKQ